MFLSLDKCWINRKQIFFMLAMIQRYASYRTFISHNMANIFHVSRILLLCYSPKGSWNKSANYEKLGKYWLYCTRKRAITNACFKNPKNPPCIDLVLTNKQERLLLLLLLFLLLLNKIVVSVFRTSSKSKSQR